MVYSYEQGTYSNFRGEKCMRKKWMVYVGFIALCELVGAIAGWLSMEGIDIYSSTIAKPPLSPPEWVFPVVWATLYALMGISGARVMLAEPSKIKNLSLNLFTVQLIVNFFWPLFFFNLQAFGFSLVWLILLWVLVMVLIWMFWKVDHAAAWLLTPYLIWVTFAVYLNAMVWLMNER